MSALSRGGAIRLDDKTHVVGMGEIYVAEQPGHVLVTLGLGSCVCIAAYDSVRVIAGMVHVVQPSSATARGPGCPGRFADTAVPALLAQMASAGADPRRLRIAVAGGAEVFSFAGAGNGLIRVAENNIAAVQEALRIVRLPVVASDLGGKHGRTVRLFVADGRLTVRVAGQDEFDLATLGSMFAVPGIGAHGGAR